MNLAPAASLSLGVLVGFGAAKLVAGPVTGAAGMLPSLILPAGNWQVHLHHWLWASILLAALFLVTDGTGLWTPNAALKTFLYGALAGIILQGIFCYSDWRRIVYR
ncbi:MAG: hypothetical protein A2X36_08210 [Elusimicrobia bacterium GWA2_69_24]|nr:MAG: hypothetical protein A2X36_08210 [Elusimicrobia bacterium GWA2_69_24]